MLKVESVTYEVKKRTIVKDITFTVRPGEVLALMGANGAGKSTLLRLISGEYRPHNGAVYLYGKELQTYNPVELAKVKATLSQHNVVNMPFLCREIIMMGRYPYHKNNPTEADHVIVEETMKVCGIEQFADRSFLTLSGGEQQRVQLARVLAQLWDQSKGLIILDEPVAGMDMLYQQQTMAIARALAQKGYMVVAVLHEINLAAQYADRIMMIKNGRRWKDGTPSEVLTPLDIYSVFSMETEVMINPRTLKPFVITREITLNAEDFNSWLPAAGNRSSLNEQYIALRKLHPHYSMREMADHLQVAEAVLLMLELKKHAVLLHADIPGILKEIPQLGIVRAQTYSNNSCLERTGSYQNFIHSDDQVKFNGTGIELNIYPQYFKIVFAFTDPFTREQSLQFYDQEGILLHKIILTDKSDLQVYERVVDLFRSEVQESFDLRKAAENISSSGATAAVVDQKMLLASQSCVAQMSLCSFKKVMAQCMNREIPIMLQAGNTACVQAYTGVIKNLIGTGNSYQVSDAQCRLSIEEHSIGSIWHVIQPSAKGPVHQLELYDQSGELMLRVMGKNGSEQVTHNEWQSTLQEIDS